MSGQDQPQNVPDWLKPWEKDGAFSPDIRWVEDLEPQSRAEALLKYLILHGSSFQHEYLKTSDDEYIGTSDGEKIMVHD